MESVRIEPVADEASRGGIPYKPESKWSAVFPFELLIGFPIGLYTAFVAQCFWNWFAAPALRLPGISLEELMDSRLLDELMMGLGQVSRNTLTLALGFGLHLMIS